MFKLIASTLLGVLTAAFFITIAWSFPDDPPGKTIFKANKCSSCHGIKAQGISKGESEEKNEKKPPDLSAVGTKHTAEWISKYLLKKETIEGDKHLKKFKGSDEDLETLSTWLAALKSK
jgi:mono/diheme cytochrome c family protein